MSDKPALRRHLPSQPCGLAVELRILREQKLLNQGDLAKKSGISATKVSRLESVENVEEFLDNGFVAACAGVDVYPVITLVPTSRRSKKNAS